MPTPVLPSIETECCRDERSAAALFSWASPSIALLRRLSRALARFLLSEQPVPRSGRDDDDDDTLDEMMVW